MARQWDINVDKVESEQIDGQQLRIRNRTYYRACVICTQPVLIVASVNAPTLAGLRREVDLRLWDEIRKEFEKKSVKWAGPNNPDLIDQTQRGLPTKQFALTHQPIGTDAL